eukprot:5408415-Prymnesium_polylepis.1
MPVAGLALRRPPPLAAAPPLWPCAPWARRRLNAASLHCARRRSLRRAGASPPCGREVGLGASPPLVRARWRCPRGVSAAPPLSPARSGALVGRRAG